MTSLHGAFLGGEGDAYAERNVSADANVELLPHLVPHLLAGPSALKWAAGPDRTFSLSKHSYRVFAATD